MYLYNNDITTSYFLIRCSYITLFNFNVKNKELNIDDDTRNKLVELFKHNFGEKTSNLNKEEVEVYVKFNWSEHKDI